MSIRRFVKKEITLDENNGKWLACGVGVAIDSERAKQIKARGVKMKPNLASAIMHWWVDARKPVYETKPQVTFHHSSKEKGN
jgi:hypothetical protein